SGSRLLGRHERVSVPERLHVTYGMPIGGATWTNRGAGHDGTTLEVDLLILPVNLDGRPPRHHGEQRPARSDRHRDPTRRRHPGEALRRRAGPRGIRVNAVAPGVVETDMSHFTKTEAGRETALGMQALKRLAQPGDIAPVVAFLASEAARWITGDSL